MLLYSVEITQRLLYIIDFIGTELFGKPIEITTDREVFRNYQGPRLNYNPVPLSDYEFKVVRSELLFEKVITKQEIDCHQANGYKAFYFIKGGDFDFDIFAACFYLLTRYEEYLPHEKDAYGRYAHTSSLAHRESFLRLPLVNIWLADFKKALIKKYPGLLFNRKPFTFLPTYDIDIAYSYLNKGLLRNAGGLLRTLLNFEWRKLMERLSVLISRRNDPYDSYKWLDTLHGFHKTKAYYFFLLAKKQRGNDKNISPSSDALRQLIKHHAAVYETGIHPSWSSGDHEEELEKEKMLLEKITEKKIVSSRQHYIRLNLPATYRRLVGAGIQKEYSMGYGGINGFRASVASSFFWYDLEKEEQTKLRIFPFCFMDANAFYIQKLTPELVLEELKGYCATIKDVNGLMITIWHNQFLGTDKMFKGWREVYENFLEYLAHQAK